MQIGFLGLGSLAFLTTAFASAQGASQHQGARSTEAQVLAFGAGTRLGTPSAELFVDSRWATEARPELSETSRDFEMRRALLTPAMLPPAMLTPQDAGDAAVFYDRHLGYLQTMDRRSTEFRASLAWLPSAELNSRVGDFDETRWEFGGEKKIPVGFDSYAVVGGDFSVRHFQMDGTGLGSGDLYRLSARLGVGHWFTDDFVIEARFRPGLFTDFDKVLSHSDLWNEFQVLGTYRYQDDLFFKGGFLITENWGSTRLLPLVGLSHLVDDRIRVDVLLPYKAELSWTDNEEWTVYGGLYYGWQQYHAGNSFFATSDGHDIRLQQMILGGGAQYRFAPKVMGFVEFGVVVAGKYQFRSAAGTYEGSLEPAPLMRIGIGFDL